jgi:di/tricarboxylate transporter
MGLWSMGHFINFLLHLIFWEFIYIGIPVLIVIAIIYLLWWKKLPKNERKEYKQGHLFGKRSHRSDAGGGISFLIFVFFVLKVYLDGNWNYPFAEWRFDYLVSSYLTALIWVLIVFGIPVLVGGIWWIYNKMNKE